MPRVRHEHYGITGEATKLHSERDTNFLVAVGEDSFILKITNQEEPAGVTDFQTEALLHLERSAPGLPVPHLKRTLPDPLPHPDHIRIDVRRGTARVVGPSTKEEKAFWDDCMARKAEFEAEIDELQDMLANETDPKMRRILEQDLAQARTIVGFLSKAERGEL